MKTFWKDLWTATAATVVLLVVVSGIYPVIIWGIAQVIFPYQANGSLITQNGQVVGSALLAQGFSGAKYFHPRPSQAGTGYDAANSNGSNLGPTSKKLMDSIKDAADAYRKENNLAGEAIVPADAATSSFSGLDPHISPKNAQIQAARVAHERGISENAVRNEIEKATDKPFLGIIGDPGVNVLKLNLALDAAQAGMAEKRTAEKK
jgi:potassium-transporting ATPase KdpC subunit